MYSDTGVYSCQEHL